MLITMLKAKLHQACVTQIDPQTEGAFAIDGDLLELAGIQEYEQVQIYNANNGERTTSYVVRAEQGSRKVSVSGSAAGKMAVGDRLIICAFADLTSQQVYRFQPAMVYCDDQNFVVSAKNIVPMQIAS